MFAKGTLQLDAGEPAPVVPLTAVRSESGEPYVLLVQDGKLVERKVSLGLKSAERGLVQVSAGLEVGELVLATSSSLLSAGMAVTLKPAAPAAVAKQN